MSQVNKDILNGWKEIAAYLGRDRRTVERWEKQRGLPVRRMPGAGRATVYALISELDEWLASSKPDEADTAEEEQRAAAPDSRLPKAEPYAEPFAKPLARPFIVRVGEDSRTAATAAPPAASAETLTVPPPTARWKWIAASALLAALVVFFVLLLPNMRRRLNPGPQSARSNPDSGERLNADPGVANSALRDHSRVAGVDDLYLAGIYSSEQRTPETLERAEQDFASAIAKDPNYAPAYAALANTYILLREYYVMPDEEAFSKAKTAAQQAVALDPRLGEAHASLGFIDFFWSWDTPNAEREFRIALDCDPTSANTRHWYGSILTHEGRFQEAMEQLNIAQRLEPTSAAILSTRALALGLSGHRGEAVDLLEGLVNESPDVSSPHSILAILSRVEPPDWERYLDETRRTAELRHSDEMLQVASAAEPALRRGGARAMWATILATEEKLHPGGANRTFLMAQAETALGQTDAAFADLNLVAQQHETNMRGVIMDPTLAPLRRDPRFGKLLQAVGLPAPPQ